MRRLLEAEWRVAVIVDSLDPVIHVGEEAGYSVGQREKSEMAYEGFFSLILR